jgi:hypothetical protein
MHSASFLQGFRRRLIARLLASSLIASLFSGSVIAAPDAPRYLAVSAQALVRETSFDAPERAFWTKSTLGNSFIDPASISVDSEGITFSIRNLSAFNSALANNYYAVDLATAWGGQHESQVGGAGVDNRFRTGTTANKLGDQSLQVVTGPGTDDLVTGRTTARGYADLDCSNPAQSGWQAIEHILGR